MTHWTEAYVGRSCGTNTEFDCGDLCKLVLKEVFGREIRIPKDRQYVAAQEEGTLAKFRAMMQQIADNKDAVAVKTENPEDGDGVLIIARGYLQHIGLYTFVQFEPYILHASDLKVGPQVVCQKVRDLEARGLRIEGYYKWI